MAHRKNIFKDKKTEEQERQSAYEFVTFCFNLNQFLDGAGLNDGNLLKKIEESSEPKKLFSLIQENIAKLNPYLTSEIKKLIELCQSHYEKKPPDEKTRLEIREHAAKKIENLIDDHRQEVAKQIGSEEFKVSAMPILEQRVLSSGLKFEELQFEKVKAHVSRTSRRI